jgi:hypothetical protein
VSLKAEARAARRRWRRQTVLVASVAILGLLAGCGGNDKESSGPSDTAPGGGQANSAPAKPACDVLSRIDVETAIGAPVRDGQAASPSVCRYDLAAGADQAVLMLMTTDAGNPQNFERTKALSTDAQPLPGVADQAYVTGKQAFLLKGATIAVIVVNLQRPPAALLDAATKLARAATAKI